MKTQIFGQHMMDKVVFHCCVRAEELESVEIGVETEESKTEDVRKKSDMAEVEPVIKAGNGSNYSH
jgi:hypothetical protein